MTTDFMPPIGGSVASLDESQEHLVHKNQNILKFLKTYDEEMATEKDAMFPE